MRAAAPSSVSTTWSVPAAVCFALAASLVGFASARALAVRRPAPPPPPPAAAPAPSRNHLSTTFSPRADWDARWRELAARPVGAARARARQALLEELARTDPALALDLAGSEANWLARDALRDAALRGWASVAPDDAADWAMEQPVLGERMKCVSAVLAGAVAQPAEAMRVGLRLCAADPEPAGTYGHMLINALVDRAGDFETAIRFATCAKMVDRQSFLLDSAFYQWARHDPDRAFSQLSSITDPAVRESALKGLVEGRSDFDPQSFADFAQKLPAGDDRTQALSISLQRWADKDPQAALQWINRADPDPDLDPGVAALATSSTLVAARPEIALELTDSICDSTKRTLTKSRVFFEWALRDRDAARRYAESVEHPETRATLLQDLESLPPADGGGRS